MKFHGCVPVRLTVTRKIKQCSGFFFHFLCQAQHKTHISKLKMASKNVFGSLRGKETIFIISFHKFWVLKRCTLKASTFWSLLKHRFLLKILLSTAVDLLACTIPVLWFSCSLHLERDLTLLGLNCTILAILNNRAMGMTCQDRSTKGRRTLTSNIGQRVLLCSVLQQYQRTRASRTAAPCYPCKSINRYYFLSQKNGEAILTLSCVLQAQFSQGVPLE